MSGSAQRTISAQFLVQVAQVFLVGLTAGMTRAVVPALASEEFGLDRGAPGLVAAMVVGFGLSKAALNLLAGAWSDRYGRKRVLLAGWLASAPVPPMIAFAPSWPWVVAAVALLGVGQGLTWSMTLTSKLDLTRPERRGLVNGVNEFAGYAAVALAGVLTADLADRLGARTGLLVFRAAVVAMGVILTLALVKETRPRTAPLQASHHITAARALAITARSRHLFAICQAGLVEKFADALVWTTIPAYLRSRGFTLDQIASTVGAYAFTWGACQLLTGPLSDRLGRKPLIAGGMALCAAGIALIPFRAGPEWATLCSALAGFGMAMLYPTLGAAVADLAPPASRGALLGAYRCWRDLGYSVGGIVIIAAASFAAPALLFPIVGACLACSAIIYLAASKPPNIAFPVLP